MKIAEETIGLLRTMALTNAEVAETVGRMVDGVVRDNERRVVAELQGWKAIATELLTIAFGKDNALGDGVLPPMELIELRTTGKLPAQVVPALEQFWRDLTLRHQAAREAKRGEVRGVLMVELGQPDIQAGDAVFLMPSGRVEAVRGRAGVVGGRVGRVLSLDGMGNCVVELGHDEDEDE